MNHGSRNWSYTSMFTKFAAGVKYYLLLSYEGGGESMTRGVGESAILVLFTARTWTDASCTVTAPMGFGFGRGPTGQRQTAFQQIASVLCPPPIKALRPPLAVGARIDTEQVASTEVHVCRTHMRATRQYLFRRIGMENACAPVCKLGCVVCVCECVCVCV
jgi:hypothetical protein